VILFVKVLLGVGTQDPAVTYSEVPSGVVIVVDSVSVIANY
jgi:hypothetical protein